MEITEVRITLMNEEKLKAYVSVTFDGCFVVRDLKVIRGNNGIFVAMPSKKMKDGSFRDIAHPLNNDFRARLEKQVLEGYQKEKELQGITDESDMDIEASSQGSDGETDMISPVAIQARES